MVFKKYSCVHEFYNAAYDVLMRDEAQNLIPLGNVLIGHRGEDKTGWRDPANWLMATVSDENTILLTAIMTPPHNIALYATDNKINAAAIDCLAAGLKEHPIPGVLAEKALAECFAKAYTKTYETVYNQRIYELTKVNTDINNIGSLRLVEERDMAVFPYWYEAFSACTQGRFDSKIMKIPQTDEHYRYFISTKQFYFLEVDGMPVSLARLNREMQTVIGIGAVYTPPYFRGRGYATSCVAKVSQIALDKGFKKCVLYTDLANPTSNSIYQKIGYRPICDSLMLKFVV